MQSLAFTPIGGGSEIGANSYLVAANGHRVLLDCGMHPKREGYAGLPDFSLLNETPDVVLVSHGHIDHCGALPYCMKRFPGTVCFSTRPTRILMDRMLHNSVSVMSAIGREREIEEYPLFSHGDVNGALERAIGMEYSVPFCPIPNTSLQVSFHPTGHVLGSAGALIQTSGHTLYYTSDICMYDQELMGGLTLDEPEAGIDTLVIESTRGAHEPENPVSYQGEIRRFAAAARETLQEGGVVLAPAFALGRTQELCNIINRLQDEGRLPDVPVYASGLGRAIYEVYNKYSGYLRPEANLCPLRRFKRIGDVWEPRTRKTLLREPAIIVATSGMMIENTPSAMLAMEMVKETHHGIFFAGYLDPSTLGYRLLHAEVGEKLIFELHGLPVKKRLTNIRQFHLSAHAPREDLLAVIEHFDPKNVVFVHGDPEAIAWMRAHTGGGRNTFAPDIGETVILER